jgi:uncharacterized protein
MSQPSWAVLPFVGIAIGFLVGLTGVGGGALMTPVLVLLGIDPLTAVSSDLVVSLAMKPVGSAVHFKRRTIDRSIVGWLALGSIPSGFSGALALHLLGDGPSVKATLKTALGVALLLAIGGITLRSVLAQRQQRAQRVRRDLGRDTITWAPSHRVRPLPTVAVGVVGGFVVGLTSVGSGSLMIVGLMLLYPTLQNQVLVGTDLAQAIPLVASAALGHAIFGQVDIGLALPLLLGAIPAVYLGSRISSSGHVAWARPVLLFVLVLTAAQLLGATPTMVGSLAAMIVLIAGLARLSKRVQMGSTGESQLHTLRTEPTSR